MIFDPSSCLTPHLETAYLNATHPLAELRLSILVAEMDAHADRFKNGQLNTERFLKFAR